MPKKEELKEELYNISAQVEELKSQLYTLANHVSMEDKKAFDNALSLLGGASIAIDDLALEICESAEGEE